MLASYPVSQRFHPRTRSDRPAISREREGPRSRHRHFSVTRSAKNLHSFISGSLWLLLIVAVGSLVSGFAEAGLLYLLIQAAIAVSSGKTVVEMSIGPISIPEVTLSWIVLAAFFTISFLVVVSIAVSAAAAGLTTRSLNRARKRIVSSFLSTSWTMQSQEPEGRLQTLLTQHVHRIGMGSYQLTNVVASVLNLFAYLGSTLLIDAVAAGVVLLGVLGVSLLLLPLNHLSKRLSRQNMHVNTHYAGQVAQSVRLAREIRVFDVGSEVGARLAAEADESERIGFRSRFLAKLTPRAYQYCALLLMVSGIAVVSSVKSSGVAELGAIVLLLVRALTYGQQLSTSIQQLTEARPFIEDVERQGRRYERDRVDRSGAPLPHVEQIELREVSFGFERDMPVLRDLSFSANAGEAVGIVGPSGSGKSTLVQLLLRLRYPEEGTYEVNRRPARDFSLDDWYKHFAFVPQENYLVEGTISDNIRFFRPELGTEAVESAARMAHLHEDIVLLADRYETMIGPGQRDLSGGQRQRLGLARALLDEPSVLVLDEPTSALDMRSEELVQQTLRELKGSVMMFVIAHRIPTLGICDRILVLENGRVVAEGTHAELQRSSPFYEQALRLSQIAG